MKALRLLVVAFSALFCLSAFAAAVVENSRGDVKAGASASAATTVKTGQRLEAGSTIITGAKSLASLRFDDGQAVVLNENSEFRITQYSFSKEDPKKDRFMFDFVKGAMRSVTGTLTRRNADAYSLRMPQATIGIRGTDFMVAIVNPAFISVLSGTVTATNKAGSASFSAGSAGTVPSATVPPSSIPASSFPASVTSAFSELSSLTVTAAAGAEAAGAAFGGITPGVAGVLGAIAAGLAGLAGGDNASGTTGTTGTTGTR